MLAHLVKRAALGCKSVNCGVFIFLRDRLMSITVSVDIVQALKRPTLTMMLSVHFVKGAALGLRSAVLSVCMFERPPDVCNDNC